MAKVWKSLNPEAPEFLPKRNQNPPFPSLQSYTMQFIPPSLYTNTYSAEPVLPPRFPSPALSASFTEPAVPLLMIPEQHYAAEAAVRKGDHGVARRGHRTNRFSGRIDRRRGFKGRENQDNNKPECKPKFNKEYHFFRNLQRRAAPAPAPPQLKHPVLPVRKDGRKTTVMIRNIPNRYTREMLMDFLDDHCIVENRKAEVKESGATFVSAFDFLYLPIDFQNSVNKGYAFVNFTEPRAVWKFYLASHNMRWNAFQSNKICEIAYARLQGKEELAKHFRSVDFPCDQGKEEYLPVCFSPARDGSREKVNQSTVGRITGTRIWEPSSAIKPSLSLS